MNSTNNRHRKHKSNMLIKTLPINETAITYTFTMARWSFRLLSNVKGNKLCQKPPPQQIGACDKKLKSNRITA